MIDISLRLRRFGQVTARRRAPRKPPAQRLLSTSIAHHRCRLEPLEERTLLAVTILQIAVNLYQDSGGAPGALIANDTVTSGQSFFAEIVAGDIRSSPAGLIGLALNVDWGYTIFQEIDSPFNPADVASPLVTTKFPMMRGGTLNNTSGHIDELKGGSLPNFGIGQAIGIGATEQFSLLHFQAETPTAGFVPFQVTIGSDGVSFADGTTSYDPSIEAQTIRVVPAIRTWKGESQDNSYWTTPQNWVGDQAPRPGDSLVFPADAARRENSNDYLPGTTFDSVTFSGGGYIISENRIALNGGITNSIPPGESNQKNEVQLDVDFVSAATSVVNSGGELTMSRALSASGVVTKTGTGTLIISGPQSWAAGSVLQIGSGGGGTQAGGGQSVVPDTLAEVGALPLSVSVAGDDPLPKAPEGAAPECYVSAAALVPVEAEDSGSGASLAVVMVPNGSEEVPVAYLGTTVAPAIDAVLQEAASQQPSALLELTSAPLVTEPQAEQSVSVAAPASSAVAPVSGSTTPAVMQPAEGSTAVQTTAAHDAVLAAAAGQPASAISLANEMGWLYAYEEMMARKQSSTVDNSTEKMSVDAALALYWA